MIEVSHQWCLQIDVTNACVRACSNCTRMLAHVRAPFFMPVNQFAHAVAVLRDFLDKSQEGGKDEHGRKKVLGVIGGEPLLHPEFKCLAEIMLEMIPDREQRGLWTGIDWRKNRHADLITETFGYINENRHDSECRHSPVLVSISDVVKDETEKEKLIDNCWLQRLWSGAVTPKGFFFCEVAGAMDMVFDGPGGLPVKPECWNRPLGDFSDQIDRWCQRCGIPLQLEGRLDKEEVDDITTSNLEALKALDSPRIEAGRYAPYDPDEPLTTGSCPWRYLQ